MLVPVSLPQVLASREARVLRQRRLLAGGHPVVSVTCVAPGPFKDTPAYRRLRDAGVDAVVRAVATAGWTLGESELVDGPAGPEAVLAVVDADADALKALVVAIEDDAARPWARLLDLDVLAPAPPPSRIRVGNPAPSRSTTPLPALEPLSRSLLELPPRRCLVCERPAKECARAQTHPLPELLAAASALLAGLPCVPEDDAAGQRPAPSRLTDPYAGMGVEVWGEHLGDLAYQALLAEVRHTPKPGLVDAANNGAHDDMDLPLFERSAAAIAPFLPRFVADGARHATLPEPAFLAALRPLGLACEQAMFAATGGVNTHKGAVFAFGLLLSCAGRLVGRGDLPDPQRTCAEAARIARCTLPELGNLDVLLDSGTTAGQRLFAAAGLTGARGEAASGYATVREHALPAFLHVKAATGDEELALGQALLELMVRTQDTNLAKDGGLDALDRVRAGAQSVLDRGGATAPGFREAMQALDAELIAANLSPGGCADLLAVTWFLSRWPAAELLG